MSKGQLIIRAMVFSCVALDTSGGGVGILIGVVLGGITCWIGYRFFARQNDLVEQNQD